MPRRASVPLIVLLCIITGCASLDSPVGDAPEPADTPDPAQWMRAGSFGTWLVDESVSAFLEAAPARISLHFPSCKIVERTPSKLTLRLDLRDCGQDPTIQVPETETPVLIEYRARGRKVTGTSYLAAAADLSSFERARSVAAVLAELGLMERKTFPLTIEESPDRTPWSCTKVIQDAGVGFILDLKVDRSKEPPTILVLGHSGCKEYDLSFRELKSVRFSPNFTGEPATRREFVDTPTGGTAILAYGKLMLTMLDMEGNLVWTRPPSTDDLRGWAGEIDGVLPFVEDGRTTGLACFRFHLRSAIVHDVLTGETRNVLGTGANGDAIAPWRIPGTNSAGVVIGQDDKVIALDEHARIVFTGKPSRRCRYISVIEALRPRRPDVSEFRVLCTIGDDLVPFVMSISHTDPASASFVPEKPEYSLWPYEAWLTAHVAGKTVYHDFRRGQCDGPYLKKNCGTFIILDEQARKISFHELIATTQGSTDVSPYPDGVTCTLPRPDSDDILVAWGRDVWLASAPR